jgi:hypothetical protein
MKPTMGQQWWLAMIKWWLRDEELGPSEKCDAPRQLQGNTQVARVQHNAVFELLHCRGNRCNRIVRERLVK